MICQYKAVLVCTWLDFVSRGRHWRLLGGTGSVYCGTGWYLVVLSQNRAVLVSSVICSQTIYGLHGANHQIIHYSEEEEVMTYRQTNLQTNRISYLRFDPFCGSSRLKNTLGVNSRDTDCKLMMP